MNNGQTSGEFTRASGKDIAWQWGYPSLMTIQLPLQLCWDDHPQNWEMSHGAWDIDGSSHDELLGWLNTNPGPGRGPGWNTAGLPICGGWCVHVRTKHVCQIH